MKIPKWMIATSRAMGKMADATIAMIRKIKWRPAKLLLLEVACAIMKARILFLCLNKTMRPFAKMMMAYHRAMKATLKAVLKNENKFKVQTGGKELDHMADLYGIKREDGESDEAMRERILKKTKTGV